MDHELIYSEENECYVWWHDGIGMTLDATTEEAARAEIEDLIAQGIRPTNSLDELFDNADFVEGDEYDDEDFEDDGEGDDGLDVADVLEMLGETSELGNPHGYDYVFSE